jgi:hypothetical protein
MRERDSLDTNVKRRLPLEQEPNTNTMAGTIKDAHVSLVVHGTEDNKPDDTETNERKKRSKKDRAISTSTGSAGSREEPVRPQ